MSATTESKSPLSQVLDEQGRKRRWVAEQLGVDPSEVSRWQRGLLPNEEQRERIAEILDRDVDELFPDAGNGHPTLPSRSGNKTGKTTR